MWSQHHCCCSVVSNFLQPHGLQHIRPSCPSPSPRIPPRSCSLNQWCHPTISSPAASFSCPQSFPESRSFPVSQLFTPGAKVLVLQLQHQFFRWIFRVVWSPCSEMDSQESSPIPHFKSISSSVLSFLYVQPSHPYMTTGKTIALTRQTFVV